MAQHGGDQEGDDWIVLMLLLIGASGFGLFSLSSLLAPVQTWLVEVGVLVVGEGVIVGWGESHAGLDLGRLVIAGGVLVLFALGAVLAVRKRVHRDV
jgi:hypothetical protein